VNEVAAKPINVRMKIREWWKAEIEGKTTISLPETARRAEEVFRDDPEFRDGFFDTFLYSVLYDYGVSLLSEARIIPNGHGAESSQLDAWMEYDPNSDQHVSLFAMNKEQLLDAANQRANRARLELERVKMLRELAVSPHAGRMVADPIAVTRKLRERIAQNGGIVPKASEASEASLIDGLDWPEFEAVGTVKQCRRCGVMFDHVEDRDISPFDDAGYQWICPSCAPLYPHSLLKASFDPFDYALRLRTGEVIYFQECSFRGDWVCLTVHKCPYQAAHDMSTLRHPFERGLDVRLSDIVWCADAPEGS
jgi:hypothetical protein